jgi:NAD(P)-dependent dehydrogenase (short-subunit alcohol dehydrogenase family)
MAKALKEAPAVTDWGPFSLKGRNALITGAAMGIGNGIAKRFVEAGANVVVADVIPTIESVAQEIEGGNAKGIVFDVRDAEAAAGAVQRVVDAFGSIDILVNNAGVYPMSPFLDMTPEFFDRVIGINLRGLVFLCKAAAAQMVKQGRGGKIVNVASIDSLIPSTPGLVAYDTSKGGVLMFTKALALEMAPYNITVNAIAPGGILTEGASKPMQAMAPQQLEAMAKEFVKQIPAGRLGAPDEIATVAVFLASPASSYMTGTLTVVDGGRLLK